MSARAKSAYRILHVLRAPVGGLFRHVTDLARIQASLGHQVGIVADATTGGPQAEEIFASLAPDLGLGLTRVLMNRHIGWSDAAAVAHVGRRIVETGADVVHGHGAKGGAYARLARSDNAIRVYTPHGGSLHYRMGSPVGCLYLTLEKILARRTDLLLFESRYGRDTFFAKIGRPRGTTCVVHNGLRAEEFAPVSPQPGATDLLFVGELRLLKGVDVLIGALGELRRAGKVARLTIVGEGPDRGAFQAQCAALDLGGHVRFTGAMPARQAFALGRILIVPSRAESLPYIVLEAVAAGLPVITTSVGGIPEIFGGAEDLVPAGDVTALASAIRQALDDPARLVSRAASLHERVRTEFSAESMAAQVLAAYALALRAGPASGKDEMAALSLS